MTDGVPIELRLPAPGKGPVDLRLYRAGDLALSGNHVYLDAATARVIQVDRVVDRPIGARFWQPCLLFTTVSLAAYRSKSAGRFWASRPCCYSSLA